MYCVGPGNSLEDGDQVVESIGPPSCDRESKVDFRMRMDTDCLDHTSTKVTVHGNSTLNVHHGEAEPARVILLGFGNAGSASSHLPGS